jgi:two-component system chemotaxis sensor kinase CheA
MPRTIDQSEFYAAFKTEAEEYIAKLTQGLLSLEKDPQQPAVIEEMFRSAHTIKGAAAMVGCDDIKQIAHGLEDKLKQVKDGVLSFTSALADESLAALDAITAILQRVGEQSPAPVASPVVQAAENYVVKDAPAPKLPAQPKPAAPAAPPAVVPASRGEEFIRLPISRVNALFNLVGELVVHKVKSSYKIANLRQLTHQTKALHKRLEQLAGATEAAGGAAATLMHQHALDVETLRDHVTELAELLSNETLHLDPVVDELQYKVRELRMLPCATIFEGLERLVRDVAHQLHKHITLVVQGEDTELDKKVLEALKPCLVHLLRNAADHGIELPADRAAAGKPASGKITLRASQQGGKAVIEVQDDGRGIDLARVKQVALRNHVATEDELARMDEQELMGLIFAPGFSTSAIITDVSGRGVGMDVVRKEVEQLKGQVRVDSRLGQGTTVRIELPLTLAIMEVLLVEANGQRFGVPMLAIEEIVKVKPADVQTINQRMAITLRDRTLPMARLADVLGLPEAPAAVAAEPKEHTVVVAVASERRVGLTVDRVVSEEEIFIKSLGSHLGTIKNISGGAILGTGEVIVILDVQDLLTAVRQARTTSVSARPATPQPPATRRILIAEDSLTTREFERSLLQAQGYEVETAVDGLDALEKLGQGKFDLIVSDVEMPRMNGFEFCRSVRQRPELADVPVVFVTTLDKDEEKRRGIEVGAQAYIVKGAFNQQSLLEAIERLVGAGVTETAGQP